MDNQLLEKVIKSNNDSCLEFTYDNPLLDVDVARAASKSFIKLLNISGQNSNVRYCILDNIRKTCQIKANNHETVDDQYTDHLINFHQLYNKHSNLQSSESIDKQLDIFLMRRLRDPNMYSMFKPTFNPEVVQALMNLNKNEISIDPLAKDIVHWNITDKKCLKVLKGLWSSNIKLPSEMIGDICMKIKADIEQSLLGICLDILSNRNEDLEEYFISNDSLQKFITRCSISNDCFQMCCNVFNFVLISTNFDSQMLSFIPLFIKHVKVNCPLITFAHLYPYYLGHVVMLMDIDIEELTLPSNALYTHSTFDLLREIHKESESNLIMLLSHFPQWFDLYYDFISEISQSY